MPIHELKNVSIPKTSRSREAVKDSAVDRDVPTPKLDRATPEQHATKFDAATDGGLTKLQYATAMPPTLASVLIKVAPSVVFGVGNVLNAIQTLDDMHNLAANRSEMDWQTERRAQGVMALHALGIVVPWAGAIGDAVALVGAQRSEGPLLEELSKLSPVVGGLTKKLVALVAPRS